MHSGCELVFSGRLSMHFVYMRSGSLPWHQPCSGLQGLEQKNCWKQRLRLPVLLCQCTHYCRCWGLRSSEVKTTEQEPWGQRRQDSQNTTVGEKENGNRKVWKSGLGRPFSFKVNTKLLSKKNPRHCRTHLTDFFFFSLCILLLHLISTFPSLYSWTCQCTSKPVIF